MGALIKESGHMNVIKALIKNQSGEFSTRVLAEMSGGSAMQKSVAIKSLGEIGLIKRTRYKAKILNRLNTDHPAVQYFIKLFEELEC